jgi:hypothetical protein
MGPSMVLCQASDILFNRFPARNYENLSKRIPVLMLEARLTGKPVERHRAHLR